VTPPPDDSTVSFQPTKVAAIVTIATALVISLGALVSITPRISAAEERAREAKTVADNGLAIIQSMAVRVERIQVIVERIDSGLTDKVRAEIRAALRGENITGGQK